MRMRLVQRLVLAAPRAAGLAWLQLHPQPGPGMPWARLVWAPADHDEESLLGKKAPLYLLAPRVVHHYLIPSRRKLPVADQVTGVAIISHGATFDVQIGPNGFQGLQTSTLFDRTTFNVDHLFGNIRLRKVIGNFGELWSQEFADALNRSGVRTTAGDFYNVGFTQNQDGSYTLAFGSVLGGSPNQTITVNPADLSDDTHDLNMVLLNIGAFLRVAGYSDLTTPAVGGLFSGKTAIQAVAAQTFRF